MQTYPFSRMMRYTYSAPERKVIELSRGVTGLNLKNPRVVAPSPNHKFLLTSSAG